MQLKRLFWIFLDTILPLSTEAAIARTLNEETLVGMVHPTIHAREPWIMALMSYYNPKVRALIRAIKYRGEKAPLPALGKIAADEILHVLSNKKTLSGWDRVMIVPVPSSVERLRSRGYNQAERITLAILPYLGRDVEYTPDVLARKDRQSQVRVAPERRHHNIQGAFFVLRPDKVAGTNILLIDDVVESGTTLADAKRALMDAGARDVMAVAMAR